MIGGTEHKVAAITGAGRVLKVLNAHLLATQSVFDYLTDLDLSNSSLGTMFALRVSTNLEISSTSSLPNLGLTGPIQTYRFSSTDLSRED
jgi:hypothetical protein